MRRVILLTGPARSGKDSVAAVLIERRFEALALADPIRAMLASVNLVTLTDLARKEAPLTWLGKSPRQLMQTLGTDWGRRGVHPELWIRLLLRNVRSLPSDTSIVVTDVRFENEVDLLVRALDAVVWHVTRPARQPVAMHESEAGVAFRPGHVRIANDGTLGDLRAAVLRELSRCPT